MVWGLDASWVFSAAAWLTWRVCQLSPYSTRRTLLCCCSTCVRVLVHAGVSVGYFDTEDAAARAYDRAAIGLLGRQNCKAVLNFPIEEYDNDSVPELVGECTMAGTFSRNSRNSHFFH